MLEESINFLSLFIMSLYGFLVIKKITGSNIKLLCTRNLLMITFMSFITMFLHQVEYSSLYTITVFAINIIMYKFIFKITVQESLISCGIMMIIIFVSELLFSLITITKIVSVEEIRNERILYIGANILTLLFGLIILRVKIILSKVQKFYLNVSHNKSVSNFLFLILLIVGLSSLAHNIAIAQRINIQYIVTITVMSVFFILSFLFIESKNKYSELSENYDSLFSYIQNFEEWIEKEQLNRHEYKNQLAVIRCLTKEKKVKAKIDEILEDNINIEGDAVSKLKFLPKGGLKGLMYYKTAIAQKKKINITIDVSLENKTLLNKLSEQDIRILCKLIGIYFDNAIEAAIETRKKIILLEVYELSDKVTFVFSNTFKKYENFDKRNNKGVSSKGEGHGNGLYFASKLISSNDWIESKQEIIDKYYIQQLIVHKKKTPKK